MASLDTSRAAFVQNGFRYANARASTVLATYIDAREISLDTQLDSANATTFANNYLNEFKVPKRTFELVYRGVLNLEDFVTPPRFVLTEPRLQAYGVDCLTIAATISYKLGTTTVTVRGL